VYYAADRCEIALNPDYLADGTEAVLLRLLHGMGHHWQHHFGTPGRGGYHNRQFAVMMQTLGLIAAGKQTGDSVNHSIEPGGRAARVVEDLVNSGWELTLSDAPGSNGSALGSVEIEGGGSAPRSGKRTKYTCPYGHLNAWARPGANLFCGQHGVRMEPG
jgi:hypothetical protein